MFRDEISIAICRMSRFEEKMENEDSHNCPKTKKKQGFDVLNVEIGISLHPNEAEKIN